MGDVWKWRCFKCRAKGRGTYVEASQESYAHLRATGHSVEGQWVRWRWAKGLALGFVVLGLVAVLAQVLRSST